MPPAAKNGMADAMPFFSPTRTAARFLDHLPQPRHCAGAAGNAVEGIDRRQMRLERAHELAPEQTAKRVEPDFEIEL